MRLVLLIAMSLTMTMTGQPEENHMDKHVGPAMFRVVRSGGDEVVFEPIMPIQLYTKRIVGEANPTETINKCDIYQRYMYDGQENGADKWLVTTMLKCGASTYQAQELDFTKVDQ